LFTMITGPVARAEHSISISVNSPAVGLAGLDPQLLRQALDDALAPPSAHDSVRTPAARTCRPAG